MRPDRHCLLNLAHSVAWYLSTLPFQEYSGGFEDEALSSQSQAASQSLGGKSETLSQSHALSQSLGGKSEALSQSLGGKSEALSQSHALSQSLEGGMDHAIPGLLLVVAWLVVRGSVHPLGTCRLLASHHAAVLLLFEKVSTTRA